MHQLYFMAGSSLNLSLSALLQMSTLVTMLLHTASAIRADVQITAISTAEAKERAEDAVRAGAGVWFIRWTLELDE